MPHEAVPQQYPSTQNPVAHSPAPPHVCPARFLHAPVASHVVLPLH
jgi:hypothetical protein